MAEKPEDLNLPTAVIARMIKEVLPEGVNISKEARAAISKSASVFVLYATSCANNLAMKNKRKTLSAPDVFGALEEMEFDGFETVLRESLEVYRKEQKEKKDAAELKRKQKAEASEKEDSAEKKRKTLEEDEESSAIKESVDEDDLPLAETLGEDEVVSAIKDSLDEDDLPLAETLDDSSDDLPLIVANGSIDNQDDGESNEE